MSETKTSDFSKGSAQAVLDLINRDNNSQLTLEQVDLTNMTPGEGRAASVTAVAKKYGGFHGQVDLSYNRVGLEEIPSIAQGLVEFDMSKLSGVFGYFMQIHGVMMDHNDILINDLSLTELENDADVVQEYDVAQDFKITAKPGSLAWQGEVNLQITRTRIDLKDVWDVQVLDGLMNPLKRFTWPAEPVSIVDDASSVRMYTDGSVKIFAVPAEA